MTETAAPTTDAPHDEHVSSFAKGLALGQIHELQVGSTRGVGAPGNRCRLPKTCRRSSRVQVHQADAIIQQPACLDLGSTSPYRADVIQHLGRCLRVLPTHDDDERIPGPETIPSCNERIHQRERLVEVNDYDVDLEPADHLAFFVYEDRPGMVGAIGRILGDARINIGGMQVARDRRGGLALVALTVDSAIPADVLDDIAGEMRAQLVRAVDMSR